MRRLNVLDCFFPTVKIIERNPVEDHRGSFCRLFCSEELASAGWNRPVAQINFSHNPHRGTVRGLHFQLPPYAEMKLVTCVRGEILDVVVDVRVDSPTFLRWHAVPLSAENRHALLVPVGFAHGFQTLSDDVEVFYCNSSPYAPDHESGLSPLDEALNIDWPLPIREISPRDVDRPRIATGFNGVVL